MTERAPLGPWQRVSEGTRVQRTGGALHAIANASPIPVHTSAVGDALASLAEASERTSKVDQFVLAADGAQDLTLTYLPVEDSWNAIIRSLGMYDGDDFTVSGQTFSIIDGDKAPLTGDKVRVQYDYYTGVPSAPSPEFFNMVMEIGPLAYWRLDDVSNAGTLTDSSGHAHHGTWGAVTSHTLGSSLLLNDSNASLEMTGAGGEGAHVNYGSWMNLASGMSWLILFNSTDAAARLIARESSTYVWSIQFVAGSLYFLASGATVAQSVTSALADGNRHMAVITYDGANVKIYVDGALDKTQAYTTALPTPANSDITIGYGGGLTTSHMFTGTLDEAIIFDEVLTADQVSDLWGAAT